jgi:hypothetical protein
VRSWGYHHLGGVLYVREGATGIDGEEIARETSALQGVPRYTHRTGSCPSA